MITTRTWVLVFVAATVAMLHGVALAFELYWVLPWFDIFMHLFGGATIALLVYALIDFRMPLPAVATRLSGFMVFVLLVAILWEVFEVWAGVPMVANYTLDTIVDIAMGLVGGFVGYYLGRALAAL